MRTMLLYRSLNVSTKIVNELAMRSIGTASYSLRGNNNLRNIHTQQPDIVLLNTDDPEILLELRRHTPIPILVIGTDNRIEDKVTMLGLGADDYLPVFFAPEELVARMYAIVRRARGHASREITVGPLTVHLPDQKAAVDDQILQLRSMEYQILEMVTLNHPDPTSRDLLMTRLKKREMVDDTHQHSSVAGHINRIRREIKKYTKNIRIRYKGGAGYFLEHK